MWLRRWSKLRSSGFPVGPGRRFALHTGKTVEPTEVNANRRARLPGGRMTRSNAGEYRQGESRIFLA